MGDTCLVCGIDVKDFGRHVAFVHYLIYRPFICNICSESYYDLQHFYDEHGKGPNACEAFNIRRECDARLKVAFDHLVTQLKSSAIPVAVASPIDDKSTIPRLPSAAVNQPNVANGSDPPVLNSWKAEVLKTTVVVDLESDDSSDKLSLNSAGYSNGATTVCNQQTTEQKPQLNVAPLTLKLKLQNNNLSDVSSEKLPNLADEHLTSPSQRLPRKRRITSLYQAGQEWTPNGERRGSIRSAAIKASEKIKENSQLELSVNADSLPNISSDTDDRRQQSLVVVNGSPNKIRSAWPSNLCEIKCALCLELGESVDHHSVEQRRQHVIDHLRIIANYQSSVDDDFLQPSGCHRHIFLRQARLCFERQYYQKELRRCG